MKALSQLIELFEKDSSFLKEWKEDTFAAVKKRKFLLTSTEHSHFWGMLHSLKKGRHLKKQVKLFGM